MGTVLSFINPRAQSSMWVGGFYTRGTGSDREEREFSRKNSVTDPAGALGVVTDFGYSTSTPLVRVSICSRRISLTFFRSWSGVASDAWPVQRLERLRPGGLGLHTLNARFRAIRLSLFFAVE